MSHCSIKYIEILEVIEKTAQKWLPDNRVVVSFRNKVLSHVSLGRELCQHLEHHWDVTIFKCVAILKTGKKQQLSSSVWKEFISWAHNTLSSMTGGTKQILWYRAMQSQVDSQSFHNKLVWSLRRTDTMKMCPEKKKITTVKKPFYYFDIHSVKLCSHTVNRKSYK